MATFVLVHGAYHGAWCWAAVIGTLERMGHRALALDLPGHGASSFKRADVTLQVYADGLVDFVEQADVRELVLVAHSMGGLPMTMAAPRLASRLKRMIFVDALVLRDGERAADLIPPARARLLEGALTGPDRCLPVSPEFIDLFRRNFIQDGAPALQDFVIAALQPQPLAAYLEAADNRAFFELKVPTDYVALSEDLAQFPRKWHPFYSCRLRNPTVSTIQSGHEVMFTKPIELAQTLVALARQS
ncbi:MAG TPA: alpha/beta fold hydrolase [Candidatus Binataceae bacterium]|nr:alpha/beta fold hydrolase [Candidatus Binataceae bacterium]